MVSAIKPTIAGSIMLGVNHSEGDDDKAATILSKNNLPHVSDGNFIYTQRAIEAYLVSQRIYRHSYTAELIMFMERSFKGKYRKGERSHYQRIMPSASWNKGDSLSEKLTRCKDKETFKNRFDRIGTTAILMREHFIKYEISNLNFKGRMYLRLIDTTRSNLSIFYRNDEVVDAFISAAISFFQDEQKAGKIKVEVAIDRKPELVWPGKPDVAYLENQKPLLDTELTERITKNNKGNSLALVYPAPTGKKQNPQPKRVKKTASDDSGFSNRQALELCGLIPESKISQANSERTENTAAHRYSGLDVFTLWRKATVANNPNLCIASRPTGRLIGQAITLLERFTEYFSEDQILEFFETTVKNWPSVCKELRAEGVWQTLGTYPELPILLTNSDKVLTWYKAKRDKSHEQKGLTRPANLNLQTPVKQTVPLAPYRGCNQNTAKGRTFNNNLPESLEYQIAYSRRFPESKSEFGSLRLVFLKKRTIDAEASEARIVELCNMSADEFDTYCC